MGISQTHALGRNRKFFVKAETTFGTFAKPAATDAAKVLKADFSFEQERKDRMDTRSTRSTLERITGKKKVTWSIESYILPSGTLGTAPDLGPLVKAAMGVETVNASTSVVYTLSASQSALGSVSLVREWNSVAMEALAGAWVESMTISGSGGDEPKIKFEGGAVDMYHTGTSTLNGAVSNGATSVIVQTADASNFMVGSVIQVGTSTNHQVTAKSTATLTVTPAIVGAQSSSDAVIPYVPTETVAGTVVNGIAGSVTIDAVALPITAYEVTLKNNFKAIEDEAMQAGTTDIIPGFREVTGSVTVRASKDQILHLGKRMNAVTTTRDFVITIGDTNGKKLKIDIDYAEMTFSGVESPESDEVTIQLPFKALGSAGEDELTLTFI